MRRFWASLGSLVFFIVAPGTILGLVPWWLTHWRIGPPFFGIEALRWAGVALIVLGLLPLLSSFARFTWDGLGTPAPIAPPTRLVVTGFYRHVRNPIYIALLTILLGEALLFGDGFSPRRFQLRCFLAQGPPRPEYVQQGVSLVVLLVRINSCACGCGGCCLRPQCRRDRRCRRSSGRECPACSSRPGRLGLRRRRA